LQSLNLSATQLGQITGTLHMDWYCTSVPGSQGVNPKGGGVMNWVALTFYNPTAQCGYVCWLQLDTISSPLLTMGPDMDGHATPIYAYQIGYTPAIPPSATIVLTSVSVSGGVATYNYSSYTGTLPFIGQQLVITGFMTAGNNGTFYITGGSLGSSGSFTVAAVNQANETHAAAANSGSIPAIPAITTPVSVKRDPSGAIRFYAGSNAGGSPLLYAWTQSAQVYPGPNTPPVPDPAYPFQCTGSNIGTSLFDDPYPPVPAYLISTTAKPTPMAGNSTNQAYPVYETIFCVRKSDSGDNSVILFAGAREYGRVQQASVDAGSTPVNATLRGIFDAPFPIPNQNIKAFLKGKNNSTPNGNTLATVYYGTTSEDSVTRTLSVQGSVGIMSSGQVSDGVGPAWDIAISAGGGTVDTSTTQEITVYNFPQTSSIASNSNSLVATSTIFATAMDITSTYYQWLVPATDGNWVVPPTAMMCAVLAGAPDHDDKTILSFNPYSVTAGDITSYTKEAWNATMSALGYPTNNYFDEVITPNAIATLSVSVSVGSPQPSDDSVNFTTMNVHELTWTFDASIYAGISGNLSFDLFGLGEGLEYENLDGFTLDIEGTQSEEESQEWGFGFQDIFVPFVEATDPNAPGTFQEYDVTMYFLPASSQWMNELLWGMKQTNQTALTPQQADPNSQPWRIVFLVTGYTLYPQTQNAPSVTYPGTVQFGTINGSSISAPVSEYEYSGSIYDSVWFQNTGDNPAKLSYSVAFANANAVGTPVEMVSLAVVGFGMCPKVNIPVDNSSPCATTMRYLYRSIGGATPQLVKIINNNKDTWCYDDDPAYSFQNDSGRPGPATAPTTINEPCYWDGRSNLNYSVAFVPGNKVSYCYTWLFANGESAQSPYSTPLVVTWWACPQVSLMNCLFPTSGVGVSRPGTLPVCIGRRIYRTTVDQNNTVLENGVLVMQINDNTTTAVRDTDTPPNTYQTPAAAGAGAGS